MSALCQIADIDEPSKALVPWLKVGAARWPHGRAVQRGARDRNACATAAHISACSSV